MAPAVLRDPSEHPPPAPTSKTTLTKPSCPNCVELSGQHSARDECYWSPQKSSWEIGAKFTSQALPAPPIEHPQGNSEPNQSKTKPQKTATNNIWEKTTLWKTQSSLLLSVAVTQQGISMLANQNNFESTTEWLMTLQCTHVPRGNCLLGFRRVPCFLLISQCLNWGIYTNKKNHYFKEQWFGWCCNSREKPLKYKSLVSTPPSPPAASAVPG